MRPQPLLSVRGFQIITHAPRPTPRSREHKRSGGHSVPSSQSARRFPSASARGRSAQRDPGHPGHLSLALPSRDLAWHDGPGPRVPDGPEGSGEVRPHGLRHIQGLPGGLGDVGLTDPGPPAGAHPPPGGPRLPGRPALPSRPPFSAFLSF